MYMCSNDHCYDILNFAFIRTFRDDGKSCTKSKVIWNICCDFDEMNVTGQICRNRTLNQNIFNFVQKDEQRINVVIGNHKYAEWNLLIGNCPKNRNVMSWVCTCWPWASRKIVWMAMRCWSNPRNHWSKDCSRYLWELRQSHAVIMFDVFICQYFYWYIN